MEQRVHALTQTENIKSNNYGVSYQDKVESDQDIEIMQTIFNPDGMISLMTNAPVELPVILADIIASYLYPSYCLSSIDSILTDIFRSGVVANIDQHEKINDGFKNMGITVSVSDENESDEHPKTELIKFSRAQNVAGNEFATIDLGGNEDGDQKNDAQNSDDH